MNVFSWEIISILSLIVGIVVGGGIQQLIQDHKYDNIIRYEVVETREFTQIQKYKGNQLLGARTIPEEILPKGHKIVLTKEENKTKEKKQDRHINGEKITGFGGLGDGKTSWITTERRDYTAPKEVWDWYFKNSHTDVKNITLINKGAEERQKINDEKYEVTWGKKFSKE